jgi:hypothetical protein
MRLIAAGSDHVRKHGTKTRGEQYVAAIDVELWIVFACAIAFVVCGCILTAPKRNRLELRNDALDS